MKKITLNGINYEIKENVDNCFDLEEINEKIADTDYFESYDYIFGDYSYDKVRLKGFYDSNNSNVKEINDIKNLDIYKKDYCNYGAKTFLLKKLD